MATGTFIGRLYELDRLKELYGRARLSLVVVKGRRRIGKSRLIAECAKRQGARLWSFSGLAPQEGVSAQGQRDHFARQFALQAHLPQLTFQDWTDAFEHVARHVAPGDIVLFDEISWMAQKDPTFIPKLKAWWDMQTVPFMLVLCGSVSTWIEENIIHSTAFFGRIHLTLTVEPLSLPESATLLQSGGFQGSSFEMYKLLAVLGGVPWYLEQVGQALSADTVIKRLCFVKDGLLVGEFDRIFYDLFNGKGQMYKQILGTLKEGMKTLADIRQELAYAHGGKLSQCMEHLIVAGFVQKQQSWSFKTAKPLKQSLYRISDPYIRFYVKLIEPLKERIMRGAYHDISVGALPGFEAHIGLQLEYLLLQNRHLLLKAMQIPGGEVVQDGPYRQVTTVRRKGCQVDYLVQTMTHNLIVCEFKCKRRELGTESIQAMKQKIDALAIPRGCAAIPVLFHIGGVAPTVETNGYFYQIVDIADLLKEVA